MVSSPLNNASVIRIIASAPNGVRFFEESADCRSIGLALPISLRLRHHARQFPRRTSICGRELAQPQLRGSRSTRMVASLFVYLHGLLDHPHSWTILFESTEASWGFWARRPFYLHRMGMLRLVMRRLSSQVLTPPKAVSIGFTATAVIDSTRNGLDVHTWDVRFDQYVPAAMVGWIAQVLFLISTCATKTSVLLFYRRMVKDAYSRKWLYAIWAALFGLFAYFVAVLFTYCFICQPLSAYWESYDFNYNKTYTCINGDILSPLVGVLSIISDLYAVLLPSVMLRHYNLDVPKRQKIGLNIIFALGLM